MGDLGGDVLQREIRQYNWKDGKTLTVGKRTLVMGILNITPDSFSDGGQWNCSDQALAHAEQLVKDGADIIDIGAESTRPGFTPLSAEEEISRLEHILPALLARVSVPVSIDTYKAATAAYALEQGVHMLNDIWGLQYGPESGQMAAVAARCDVPVVVMHNQCGNQYKDIISDMKAFFEKSAAIAAAAGIKADKIILDPGIGFGKTAEQNVYVLRHLQELTTLPYPMLLGTSRKGFIGKILDLPVTERMEGTGATCVAGILAGCSIVRVHDVKPISRMCKMTDALL
jgi:dihydropteroate synthase